MDYKKLLTVLVIGIMVAGVAFSGGPGAGGPAAKYAAAAEGGGEEFEAIRQAADAYVNSGKPLYYSATELYNKIMTGIGLTDYEIIWYDPLAYTRAPFILDVRSSEAEMPDAYLAGHIPGAIHIPWQQLTLFKNYKNLPKERPMVVISGTGETGAAVTALLNVLGYDAVNLMWGMTSWTANGESAPGRYDRARDSVADWGATYSTGAVTPSGTYPLPVVDNTASSETQTILLAAANSYLTNGSRRFDITPPQLYQGLNFKPQTISQLVSMLITGSPTGNPYPVPFVVDLRDSSTYLAGHVEGAINIFWKDIFKTANLEKLPSDREVLVYGDTEAESAAVSAMLCLLGYDAINLRWGVASDRFVQARDCMDYDLVSGFAPFLPCPG